ncbi:hypothetical protein V2J09_010418 [Rumex salicifolius]
MTGVMGKGWSIFAPFHPFGGAVDIIVVRQQDGSFRTNPWYVRFGKFQGVLKRSEKKVRINVNGVEAKFHMYLDNAGEAYFSREVDNNEESEKDGGLKDGRENSHSNGDLCKDNSDDLGDEKFDGSRLESMASDPGVANDVYYAMRQDRLERSESDACNFYDFQDDQASIDGSIEFSSEYGSSRFENLDGLDNFMEAPSSDSEMVLVSIDGHMLKAPISSFKQDIENVGSVVPQFHLAPAENAELREGNTELNASDNICAAGFHNDTQASPRKIDTVSAECSDSNSGSSLEKNMEDIKDKEDMYQHVIEEAIEVDMRSVDKDQRNHEMLELEVCEVVGEQENQNQVDDFVNQNQECDVHVHNSDKGALLSTENGDEEMQSEKFVDYIHEDVSYVDGDKQSKNSLVDIHEEAQEKSAQNLQLCDTDAEHPQDNHAQSMQTSKETEARHEDEVSIENLPATSFSNSTSGIPYVATAVNGRIESGEETVTSGFSSDIVDEHLTQSYSYEDTPSVPNNDDAEAEVSINEVEKGTTSSGELQARSDLSKDLTVAESDDTDSEILDRHLTIRTTSPSQSSPNGCTSEAGSDSHEPELETMSAADLQANSDSRFEISICRHLLHPGMGLSSAAETFNKHRVSAEEFKLSATSIIKDENLVVRLDETYLPWDKAAHIVLGMAAFGLDLPFESKDAISVEQKAIEKLKDNEQDGALTPGRGWGIFWRPRYFGRSKTLEPSTSNVSSEDIFLDPEASHSASPNGTPTSQAPHLSDESKTSHKKFVRTNIPTSEQIASLNLKDGQNVVTFSFCTRVWGLQRVEAHIYLWKYNARIVISDVDGTITKSDVLGQFMPLVGRDWSQSGVAKLFSAIKENGYQLLFLSARAIVQAYLTRSFLLNLKQDGNSLPAGPVVISPDGLFPSLIREVIRRAPHEFKIACLQEIRALFPADHNPFYAGFGNRDTDELSYRKIGIPKGKIFIINPKGEVAISQHRIDVKSYTSLHTLVNDMFPPTSMIEQEDYNPWNYWKIPIAEIDDL